MRSNSLNFLSICGKLGMHSIFLCKNLLIDFVKDDKLFLQFEGISLKTNYMKFTNPYHMISFINDTAIKLVILTIS